MFGFHKEEFECLITSVIGETAFVYLMGKEKEESYMEIPIEDLEKNNIECRAQERFTIIFKKWKEWEKMTLISWSSCTDMPETQEDMDKLTKHYEEKYGEV